MGLWDKLADVTELLKTGYQRHFGDPAADEDPLVTSASSAPPGATVESAEQARHILEVSEASTLDEVRDAYRRLARLYHPQTVGSGDESEAAQRLMGTLLEALELLEEHLLPLPSSASVRRQNGASPRR